MALEVTNVRAEMKALEVGESAEFPIARYDYIVSCRTRLQMTTDMRFTSATTPTSVIITRVEDVVKVDLN